MKKRAGNGCGGNDDGRIHRYAQLHKVKLLIDVIHGSKIIKQFLFSSSFFFFFVCQFVHSHANIIYNQSLLQTQHLKKNKKFFCQSHICAQISTKHNSKIIQNFWKHFHLCLQIYRTWPSKPKAKITPHLDVVLAVQML